MGPDGGQCLLSEADILRLHSELIEVLIVKSSQFHYKLCSDKESG